MRLADQKAWMSLVFRGTQFLLLKATFSESSQDSKAAKPQVSLQVPEGTGSNEPPASRGLVASVLLQASLFLEVDSLRGLGFSSLLVLLLLLLLQKELFRGNVSKRQRHLPVYLRREPAKGMCTNSPFLLFSWSTAALFQRICLYRLPSANTAAIIPSVQFSRVS